MKKPDITLIQEAIQGNRTAFRQIVENTQGMVYQVAYRLLGDRHESEDAVQEIYVRLWKNLPKYKPEIKLSTWLYRITTNYCLDVLKSARYRAAYQSRSTEEIEITGTLGADQEFNRQEAHELVLRAARNLTPVQKAVFILRDLEGRDVEEVCTVLSMNPDSIKSNLYHARKKMSRILRPLKNELS